MCSDVTLLLRQVSLPGPAYDLPTIMTKMLHLGMPLDKIVAAVTTAPASALGMKGGKKLLVNPAAN